MIVILHALCFLRNSLFFTIKGFYDRHTTRKNTENDIESYDCEVSMPPRAEFIENGVKFSPPAYLQRYGEVCDILKCDSRWAGKIYKVVDFGCAELSFFVFLKKIEEVRSVLEVDFDGPLLEHFCTRAEPLLFDHLIQRSHPLKILVLQGSVADPDARLLNCDAVVAIELIEHLSPGAFERLPHNIFGYIKPHVAFITTPNADFNVLFPNLKDGGFRHWDHRFEWSRQQFEDWALNITQRYPAYSVEFLGIAPGPVGTEELGCSSQMAVFVNKEYVEKADLLIDEMEKTEPQTGSSDANSISKCMLNLTEAQEVVDTGSSTTNFLRTDNTSEFSWDCTNWEESGPSCPYKKVAEYNYPFQVDNRTDAEKIYDDIMMKIMPYVNYGNDYYNEEEDCWNIPLHKLITHLNSSNEADIMKVLADKDFEIKNDCIIYKKSLSNISATDDSYDTEHPTTTFFAANQEENWDNFYDASEWGDTCGTNEETGNRKELSTDICNTDEVVNNVDVKTESKEFEITNSKQSVKPFTQPETPHLIEPKTEITNKTKGSVVPVISEHTPMPTNQLIESTASISDEHSHSSSPLGQFYGPNRDLDEQRLSDSGYLKSQDSPQSPVCSDTFSNDLITPDKDYSELQQSTILECIPENLHCLSIQSKSKDICKSADTRRKSIGPGIGPSTSKGSAEDEASRPKSLHVCYACDGSIVSNLDMEVKKDPDSPLEMNESPTSCQRNTSSPQLDMLSPDVVDEEMDERLRVENVPRHIQMVALGVHNRIEARQHAYNLPERLLRPDFLDIQILERVDVVNGDRLNNNLDFEGNNQEGRGDVDYNEEYNGELLRQHLDRDNENHLIINDDNILLAPDHREIVEDVLEYQEVNEDIENDDFYNRLSDDDVYESLSNIQSPVYDDIAYNMNVPEQKTREKEISFSEQEDYSETKADGWDSNNLLESIAQTLSLTSTNQFHTNFPCCSKQLSNVEDSLKSDQYFSCTDGFRSNKLSNVSICESSQSNINISLENSSVSNCDKNIHEVPLTKSCKVLFNSRLSMENEIKDLKIGILFDDPYTSRNMFEIIETDVVVDDNVTHLSSVLENEGLTHNIQSDHSDSSQTICSQENIQDTIADAGNILNEITDKVANTELPDDKPCSSQPKTNAELQSKLDTNKNINNPGTSKNFYDIDLVEMYSYQTCFGTDSIVVPNGVDIAINSNKEDTPQVDELAPLSSYRILPPTLTETEIRIPPDIQDSSTYFLAADAVFPDWLLTLVNIAENVEPPLAEGVPPNLTDRQGGGGDGVGVHSRPSTTSSGVSSLTSNTSNDAQMDPSEDRSLSSEELLLFASSVPQPRDYYESSSSSSDVTLNRHSNMIDRSPQTLNLANLRTLININPPNTSSSNSTNEDDLEVKDHALTYSLHVLTSDTSGNDADIEIESESESD